MVLFRFIYRMILLILIQLGAGVTGLLFLALMPFPRVRFSAITWAKNIWARLCCWALGLRIHLEGSTKQVEKGGLIVSNHVGLPDIFVIAACFRTFFVSKADVRSWPGLGALAQFGATIFIDRSRRTDVAGMVRKITDRIKSGYSVAVFPEGGATLGEKIEPFKTSAFESVVQAKSRVIPVVIRYMDGTPSVAAWQLYVPFWKHVLQLLIHPRLNVRVWVLPEVSGLEDRREYSEASRQRIMEKFEATRTLQVK